MLKDLVAKSRSYRRFYEDEKISLQSLKELIDLARLSPSGANAQALRFKLVNSDVENEKVFSTLTWAASLPEWDGPEKGERPSAYIIILFDNSLGKTKLIDEGIACQSIMLGAVEKGLGGCILVDVNRNRIADLFNIDTEKYTIGLVIALGKPKETVKITDVKNGSTKYYRDENSIHYVPKLSLDDLIV